MCSITEWRNLKSAVRRSVKKNNQKWNIKIKKMKYFHSYFKEGVLITKLIMGFIAGPRLERPGKMNKKCKKMQEIGKKCQVLNRNAQKMSHFCALLNIFEHFLTPGKRK